MERSLRYFVTCSWYETLSHWMVCYLLIHHEDDTCCGRKWPICLIFSDLFGVFSPAVLTAHLELLCWWWLQQERVKNKFGNLLILGLGICSPTHTMPQTTLISSNLCRQEMGVKALMLKECTWANPQEWNGRQDTKIPKDKNRSQDVLAWAS